MVTEGLDIWASLLESFTGSKVSMAAPQNQTYRCEAIGASLKECGDPDWRIWTPGPRNNFVEGVELGFRDPLPRVPSVFERKRDWRSYDDVLAKEEVPMMANYPSVKNNEEAIAAQFQEEVKLGMLLEVDEATALEEYGPDHLHVAALAPSGKRTTLLEFSMMARMGYR